MTGFTLDDIIDTFSNNAGYVGQTHTEDGIKPLYSITHPRYFNETIYATDTAILLREYKKCYTERDGLFELNMEDEPEMEEE